MLYVKQQHTFVLGYIGNHFFLKLAFLYSFSTYIRLVWFFFATYKNYFTVRKLPLFVTVLGSGSSATANVCEVSEARAESCKEWTGKTIYFNFSSIFGDFFLKFLKQSNKLRVKSWTES